MAGSNDLGERRHSRHLPLEATLATEEVYGAFYGEFNEIKTFFHGHSYAGNQLGCAAGLANLEIFERAKLVEQASKKADLIEELLEKLKDLDHVGDIRQCGMMCGIELIKEQSTKEPFPFKLGVGYQSTLKMRELGMLTRPLGDVIVFMPPPATNHNELKEMLVI